MMHYVQTLLSTLCTFSDILGVLFVGDVSLIPVRIAFTMIGKFAISGAFVIVIFITPEVFPTTLRSITVP